MFKVTLVFHINQFPKTIFEEIGIHIKYYNKRLLWRNLWWVWNVKNNTTMVSLLSNCECYFWRFWYI